MDANNCRQRVAELRNQGLTIKQIAQLLGIQESRVILEIHMLDDNESLQEKCFSDKIRERRLKVVELYNKGLSSAQIAQELGISVWTVGNDINIVGCAQPKRDRIEARRLKVAELCTKGLTAQAIAEELNVSMYAVYRDIQKLIENGNICAKPNVAEERRQKIVELYNKGLTNSQIAKEMGTSVTAVVRIISSISERPDIYKLVEPEGGRPISPWNRTNVPAETLYNLRLRGLTNVEIAELLDVNPDTIASNVSKYRERHNLPYPSNSPNKSSKYKPIHIDTSSYEIDAYRLYKGGISCEKIANALGVSVQEVYSAVRTISNVKYLEEQEKREKRNQEQNKPSNTDILIPKIVELYNNGFTHKDIAKQLNISTSWVNQLIHKAFKQGLIEHNRNTSSKTSLDLMPNVVALYKSGMPYREIATQLGIPINDVTNLIHAAKRRGLVQLSGPTRIPEDVKKTLLQLRAQGKTVSEIVAATGQPYDRVYSYLTRSKDVIGNGK